MKIECQRGCTLEEAKRFPQIGKDYLTHENYDVADELRLTQCQTCGKVWQLYRDACRRMGRDPWHGEILRSYR